MRELRDLVLQNNFPKEVKRVKRGDKEEEVAKYIFNGNILKNNKK
jgi:hypothetical protein